jgi:hypothetical protein
MVASVMLASAVLPSAYAQFVCHVMGSIHSEPCCPKARPASDSAEARLTARQCCSKEAVSIARDATDLTRSAASHLSVVAVDVAPLAVLPADLGSARRGEWTAPPGAGPPIPIRVCSLLI